MHTFCTSAVIHLKNKHIFYLIDFDIDAVAFFFLFLLFFHVYLRENWERVQVNLLKTQPEPLWHCDIAL